ncbi:SRPBCC family protein [Marinihelvus fidelis]|nr:GyrI-like domain-containing protein [Marinihelvus fidelis]
MKKLLFILLLLLAAFIGGAFLLPTRVHVERSIAIERPPETVFALLNGYRHFNRWSPWAEADPDAVYRFSGPATGVGARLDWSGDPALVGEGWQEIVASQPYERIDMRLDFGTQGVADSAFIIHGDRIGSRVTWTFDTDVTEGQGMVGGLLGRYFGLFLDDWIGSDFDKGLAAFQAFAESLPRIDAVDASIERVDVEPFRVLAVNGESSLDADAISAALGQAYGSLTAWMANQGIPLGGQPLAVTLAGPEDRYRFEAAIPVDPAELDLLDPQVLEDAAPIVAKWSPSGPSVRMVHVGPYDTLAESYERLAAWMMIHGLEQGGLSWEQYVSDPGMTPESELVTHLYVQLAPATD